jgi:cell division septation protein DedD
MPKNEEGEFELVLGNRQLLSIFFIVVILFGVFFTMGYIVGRNSAPAVASESGLAKGTVAETQEPAAEPAAASPAAVQQNKPAQEPPTEAAAPAPPKREEPAPEPLAPLAQAEPGPGNIFLQVAAVGRSEAEVEVGILKKRGYPALVGPGPREGVFRVLVGPYRDAASAGKAKADLENLGFKPIVRK